MSPFQSGRRKRRYDMLLNAYINWIDLTHWDD